MSGCREVVTADGQIALDFDRNSWQLPTISVIVPHNKTLILVSQSLSELQQCMKLNVRFTIQFYGNEKNISRHASVWNVQG